MSSRREFLKNLGLFGLIGGSLITTIPSCESYVEKSDLASGVNIDYELNNEPDPAKKKNLNRIGYGVLKKFDNVNYGIPVIIMKMNDNEFACFSSMCTHNHCLIKSLPLGPYEGFKTIICDCHGSTFDPYNHAIPTKGPAEKHLKEFKTKFNKETNILTIEF
jgi:Rieske Fe-S protein